MRFLKVFKYKEIRDILNFNLKLYDLVEGAETGVVQ